MNKIKRFFINNKITIGLAILVIVVIIATQILKSLNNNASEKQDNSSKHTSTVSTTIITTTTATKSITTQNIQAVTTQPTTQSSVQVSQLNKSDLEKAENILCSHTWVSEDNDFEMTFDDNRKVFTTVDLNKKSKDITTAYSLTDVTKLAENDNDYKLMLLAVCDFKSSNEATETYNNAISIIEYPNGTYKLKSTCFPSFAVTFTAKD